MPPKTGPVSEGLRAMETFEGLDLIVHIHVTHIVATHGEPSTTDSTGIGGLVEMHVIPVQLETS